MLLFGLVFANAHDALPDKMLAPWPQWLMVSAAVSTALALASIGPPATRAVERLIARKAQVRARREFIEGVRAYIPFMPNIEREIIGWLLKAQQKTFGAALDGGFAATLGSRGIVVSHVRSGQQVALDFVPFTIPDDVWAVLVKREADFPKSKSLEGRLPWRDIY